MTSTMCLQSAQQLPDHSLETTETKASETPLEKVQKRKSTEPSMVLGPGQAGLEVAQPTKKSKVADEAETPKDATAAEQYLQHYKVRYDNKYHVHHILCLSHLKCYS